MALRYEGDPDEYPPEVVLRIRRDEPADYERAARAIGRSDIDVVSIQHEYGIWGGPDGASVIDFVRALRRPVVTTLHTVPQNPSPGQHRILTSLVERSAATVVMSRSAARLLRERYARDGSAIHVVAHGVPDLPLTEPDSVKPELGLEPRPVILSFGLIGPGKGYESVIEAMPEVVRAEPRALYVILGATHPELLRREGEAYRLRLMRLADGLGVRDSVRFVDRYVSLDELGRWLEAADIFVTPFPNLDQIVSGTLSYAMGAGKAIVSTPYAYAQEMLEDGTGILVPAGSSKALAEALSRLLGDGAERRRLGRIAYAQSRSMIWPEVGDRYREIFESVASGRRIRPAARLGLGRPHAPVRRPVSIPVATLSPMKPAAIRLGPARPGRAHGDG